MSNGLVRSGSMVKSFLRSKSSVADFSLDHRSRFRLNNASRATFRNSFAENDDGVEDDRAAESIYGDSENQEDQLGRKQGLEITDILVEVRNATNIAWEGLSNNQIPVDIIEFLCTEYERRGDAKYSATYTFNGDKLPEVQPSPVLDVALIFLPGQDRQKVIQNEESSLKKGVRQSLTADWKVNTAAMLMFDYKLSDKGTVVREFNSLRSEQMKRKFNNTTKLDDKMFTVESDRVHIVEDFAQVNDADLKCTCIEVDGTSLMAMMMNFRVLMGRNVTGGQFDVEGTQNILMSMMEDARRLFIRSPSLTRIRTRHHIIHAEDIRYGINDGYMFRTLITSRGVAENLLSYGTSFYQSLKRLESVEKAVRPRFLQMLVLLLSLLNNVELDRIKDSIESVYGLKADRPSIELAVMKVLNLEAVSSRMFLDNVVAAYIGDRQKIFDYEYAWNVLYETITQNGYLLPGNTEQIGHEDSLYKTWAVRWDHVLEKQFSDTTIFNNLQHKDPGPFNSLLPLPHFGRKSKTQDVLANFVNGCTYLLSGDEINNITTNVAGTYNFMEEGNPNNINILTISDYCVSEEVERAIPEVNEMMRILNQSFESINSHSLTSRIYRKPRIFSYKDLTVSGRLFYSTCILNGELIAIAFKMDRQNINKNDLVRKLNTDIMKVTTVTTEIQKVLTRFQGPRVSMKLPFEMQEQIGQMSKRLVRINRWMEDASRTVNGMVQKSSGPVDTDVIRSVRTPSEEVELATVDRDVWRPYSLEYKRGGPAVMIYAKRYVIQEVVWDEDGEACKLVLCGSTAKVKVMPLAKVGTTQDSRDNEVEAGNYVVVAGQLAIICDFYEEKTQALNYMRLIHWSEPVMSKKDRFREAARARRLAAETGQAETPFNPDMEWIEIY